MNVSARVSLSRFIVKAFSLFNYIDGEDVVEETPVVEASGVAGDDLIGGEPINDLSTYMGSKDLNPEGRTLKTFNRNDFTSKEDMDDFLRAMKEGGEDIFLPTEQQKPQKRGPGRPKADDKTLQKKEPKDGVQGTGEKDADGKKGGSADANADGKKGGSGEEGSSPEEEVDTEKFLEDIGVTLEEFQALPEKVQEKLAAAAEASPTSAVEEKLRKVETDHLALVNDVVRLKNDPVVAARLEEINSGKLYVAKDIPPITPKEAENLLTLAGDPAEFIQGLNELIAAKAQDVLKIERGVLERNTQRVEREKKAAGTLAEVIAKDKRFSINEKDVIKLSDENHPEHDKFFGAGSLMEMIRRKKYSPAQIIEKGPQEILDEYAKIRGWDKEDTAKIVKTEKQSLLNKLRQAPKIARMLDAGKKAAPVKSLDNGGALDRQTLISNIASGKTSEWSKLIAQAGDRGDDKMVAQLQEIYDEGMNSKRKA